jgi:hypothetical protein
MSISLKSASVAAAMLAAIAIAPNASAGTGTPPGQVAQTAAAVAGAVTLPEVVVHPRPRPQPDWYYDPYVSGRAQRPSSLNNIPYQHFKVPVGYDSNMTMHPYTSGFGPCTMGASPSQGCHHPTGDPIPPSHYEQPPFNQ